MHRNILRFSISLFVLILGVQSTQMAHAVSVPATHESPPTPADLIKAVNNLRVSYGLNSLNMHPVLMKAAQKQADALAASDGAVGHARPGGMTLEAQLISLGYPLSGDLSMGGYRSENWICGHDFSAEKVVEMWLGDELHANTMLSDYRSDIGAGVTVGSDGQTYYVIDTALQTKSGKPQSAAYPILTGIPMTQTAFSGSTDQTGQKISASQYIVPVTRSTARPDGDVIHEVHYGQSLWSLAIAYETKIDEIRRFNNLAGKTIYTGQRLLIQKGATQPPPSQAEQLDEAPTASPKPLTATPTRTATDTPKSATYSTVSENANNAYWLKLVGKIILLAFFLHGVVVLLSRRTKKD
jgi:uncharacterized protein YkwD